MFPINFYALFWFHRSLFMLVLSHHRSRWWRECEGGPHRVQYKNADVFHLLLNFLHSNTLWPNDWAISTMDRISKFDCTTKPNTKFNVIFLVRQYISPLHRVYQRSFGRKKKLFQFKNFTREPKSWWDLKNDFVSTVDNLQWNPFNDEKNGFFNFEHVYGNN